MEIDVITGLLGAGKTTFLKHYVGHLCDSGIHPCVIACDLGAISIDRAILSAELEGICDVEMVTAGDLDCFLPRLQAKLVSVYMLGYNRIIMEPSGSFDVDDLYNLLLNDPLDRWYTVGNVIAVVDATAIMMQSTAAPDGVPISSGIGAIKENNASSSSVQATVHTNFSSQHTGLTYADYLLTAGCASAGMVFFSKVDQVANSAHDDIQAVQDILPSPLRTMLSTYGGALHCNRDFSTLPCVARAYEALTEDDWRAISTCGNVRADLMKLPETESTFENLFYYHLEKTKEEFEDCVAQLFGHPELYGKVQRVKGFMRDAQTEKYYSLNVTADNFPSVLTETNTQQEVVLIIGEALQKEAIGSLLGETRRVSDYTV